MDAPVRVLHVLGRLDICGAETLVMNIYRNIDRTKVQFDFMLHTGDKCAYESEVAALGGEIFRIPAYKALNHFKYKSEWRKFFKNNSAHKIIHGHMTSTAAIYLKIAKKHGLTAVSHAHNTSSGRDLTAKIKDIMQLPIKNTADYLFACSKAAGIWCYGRNIGERPDFKVVNNAIDAEKFIFDPFIRELKRKELGLENKFVICHVGRFEVQKNHSFLIDIFKEIYEKNHNAVLLLTGEGPLRGDIEKKAESLNLKDNVIFTGVCSDIPDLLCAADVFLFPSLWEGLGIVLIEAQASGLHCIASDVVPEEAKITGLLEYVSLDKPASYWAEKVLSYDCGYERKNMRDGIKNAGYDIKEGSKRLEDFYLCAGV